MQGSKGNKGNKGDRGLTGPRGPIDGRAFTMAVKSQERLNQVMNKLNQVSNDAKSAKRIAAQALRRPRPAPRIIRRPRRRRRFRFRPFRRRRRRRRRWSDERLKENIVKLGESALGIPIYKFNYKKMMHGLDGIDCYDEYTGVLAQDLLKLGFNDAVKTNNFGIYFVDYNMIDVDFGII